MVIRENWGVARRRIEEFFFSLDEVRRSGDGSFQYGNCVIRLIELPSHPVGPFSFPGTQIEFSGPEQETEEIHRRFVLQFISAGA